MVQTAIRGLQPNPDQFHLSDFALKSDPQGHPITLTCPNGQTVIVPPTRTHNWQARFTPAICAACPFQQAGRCPTQPQKRDPRYLLAFTTQEILTAERRKAYLTHKGDGHNLRSAVEATMRSVKHAFPTGKLPVRGKFRVTCMTIAAAATTNVRRIQRYLVAKTKRENEQKQASQEQERTQGQPDVSFSASLKAFWNGFTTPFSLQLLCLQC